jgi:signal transduction histidine kinase
MENNSAKPVTPPRQWAVKLAAARRQLKQEITQRKIAETSLKRCEQHHAKLITKSRQMQEQLRNLSHKILVAQEEERKQISRELHDEIAQTLASIYIYLEALKSEAKANTKGLGRNISRTQKLVEKSVETVHRFACNLRPTMLDDLGLIPALHSYAKSFTKRTNIQVRIEAVAAVEELNSTKRTVLFRVAQESLINISKHAKASRAILSLQKNDGGIRMRISDNGKSFSVERTLHSNRIKRLGLIGMRERVEMVGGIFSVESEPGKGTTVCAQIMFDTTSNADGMKGVSPQLPKEINH